MEDRGRRQVSEGRVGLSVTQLLALPVFAGATVLAGGSGLERLALRFNVLDSPSIEEVARPDELLLTTGYPLLDEALSVESLIRRLDAAGVVGLAVKTGPYVSGLEAEAVATADELGFPVIGIPRDRALDDVLYGAFRALVTEQEKRITRSEQVRQSLLQIVLRGDGFDDIAHELATLVDAPVAIVSATGGILGAARIDSVGIDRSAEARIDVVDESVVRVDGHATAAQVVIISAGSRLHGYVVAFGEDIDDLHRPALESTAMAAALELTKRLELRAIEDKYRSDLMHDLVTHVDDREDALRRAAGFGWNVHRRLIAIVVRLDDRSEVVVPDELNRQPALAAALRQSVVDRDPEAAVAQFGHEVVVLTAAFEGDGGRRQANVFVRGLIRQVSALVGSTVSAGQSRPVEDVSEIRRAYAQASDALAIGREIVGRGAVQHFADLGAYRLLWQVGDTDELQAFVDEMLGPLAGSTSAGERLRTTLEALLECSGNIAETARRLDVHYNTIRRRVERMEETIGPVTADRRTRLNVELALLALEMLERREDGRIRGLG